MIVLLNGPFGAGKSTVARLLAARLPRTVPLEAETLGVWLFEQARQINPELIDFRDVPLWRPLFASAIAGYAAMHDGTVVVPMSIYPAAYLREVLAHLREAGADVRHFCLMASQPTVKERLRQRGDSPRAYSWQHIDRITAAFGDLAADSYGGAQIISTDGKTADEVTAEVLRRLLVSPS